MERVKTFVNGGRFYPADINSIQDRAAEMLEGTAAAIPGSHFAGRFYRATDTGQLFLDNGTSWILQNCTGKAIVSTEQSRTNTAYGVLATPDEVTVVLPENGLIEVFYQATWAESVSNAARAAIFLGSNQLKFQNSSAGAELETQAAGTISGASAGLTAPLATCAFGLMGIGASGGSYPGDTTTGQAIGAVGGTYYVGPTIKAGAASSGGGPCTIFAAAGTYKVSIQFKSSSGSVTVKNRKLWVGVRS